MSLSTSNLNSKLLTASFIKVCSANFLLFFALYMVLPIPPFEVESSLEGYSSWYIYLLFVVGLLIGGPFHNYLIENFNRKKICSLAYLGVISPALLFLFTTNTLLLFLGVLVQGVCFGLATAASITIAIDVTSPRKRGKGNIIYAWAGRSGMVLAVPISIYLQLSYGYEMTVYVSMASGILALLLTRLTHHPFRAPNEVSKLSLDRFILPQGWRLILMMVALAFIPGSMFPHFMENLQIKSFYIVSDSWVFILLPFVVFILSAILSRLEIDALLHNKGIGFLLSRVPIILIAIYVFSNFYSELSHWSILIAALMITSFLAAILTSIMPHRVYPKMNKWVLESQYRLEVTSPIFSGLLCMLLALFLEQDLHISDSKSYILITQLLLFGLARVSSPIFLLLILSSKHCERGTANTSHHLAWEVGLILGAVTPLVFNLTLYQVTLINTGLVALALVIYLYVHYKLHKLTSHKHTA